MFQIGDHVMLKENEANDYLSEYYGQVFEVKGIDHIDGTREAFIDVENRMIKTSWFSSNEVVAFDVAVMSAHSATLVIRRSSTMSEFLGLTFPRDGKLKPLVF